MDMYTLLYLKWITNKDLPYSAWNSAQCYVAVCTGGMFGGEWIHVYVWLSPFTVHLKHCQLAISQHKMKSLKFEKKSTSCRLNNRWNSKCAKLGYAQWVMQIRICQDCTVVHKVDFKPDSCRLTLSPWALLSTVPIWLTHTHTHTHTHARARRAIWKCTWDVMGYSSITLV